MLSENPLLYQNPSCIMGGANSAFEPFKPAKDLHSSWSMSDKQLKKKERNRVLIKIYDKIINVFICIGRLFRRIIGCCRFKPTLDKHCTYQTIKIHRVY
jgi:hypothetical protein